MNRNRKGTIIIGGALIAIGILYLLNNLDIFEIYFDIFDIGFLFSRFWPLALIIPGLIFHYVYFTGKAHDVGLLVPGGILLVTGATCQISMLFSLWSYLWPGFILAVAVGLFELYLFGTREKALLIPVCILGGVSLVFFSMSLGNIWFLRTYLVPAILIIGGILVIVKNRRI